LPLGLDGPEGIAKAMGVGVSNFAQCYQKTRPDILMVLGDRFEMHAAALAALPFKIPVAHIHGGELTFGAIDNALRYSITMLAHLHFVSTEEYRRRLLQLGEEPWRVYCTGAPALDCLKEFKPLSLEALASKFDLSLPEAPILVTYHPVTLEYEKTQWQVDQLLQALEAFDLPILFTEVNTDTGHEVIRRMVRAFVQKHHRAQWVANLGPSYYLSMLKNAKVMVGNSSSGLIEAPSFGLPVVNIGSRQGGRIRANNVIDVGYSKEEIVSGIQKALSKKFRESLKGMKNPYGEGKASEQIVNSLKEVSIDQKLLMKKFVDHVNVI